MAGPVARPGVPSGAMGTAPAEQLQPAMPDPGRLVARSVTVLRRLGMTRAAALGTVVTVATHVHDELVSVDPDGVAWLTAVIHDAASQLAGFPPSETD